MREWEKNIRTVEPYVPGEQPKNTNVIKLNTNENPYPPAPGVIRALKGEDEHGSFEALSGSGSKQPD